MQQLMDLVRALRRSVRIGDCKWTEEGNVGQWILARERMSGGGGIGCADVKSV